METLPMFENKRKLAMDLNVKFPEKFMYIEFN